MGADVVLSRSTACLEDDTLPASLLFAQNDSPRMLNRSIAHGEYVSAEGSFASSTSSTSNSTRTSSHGGNTTSSIALAMPNSRRFNRKIDTGSDTDPDMPELVPVTP